MCLDTITGKPKRTNGYGWKAFLSVTEKRFTLPFYSASGRSDIWSMARNLRGRWYTAGDGVGLSTGWTTYPLGFHIFLTRKEAEKWVGDRRYGYSRLVGRIRYRGAHTEGTQSGLRVIVAREMMVLPEKKA